MSANAAPSAAFWRGPVDYALPEELIAQHPAPARTDSRLMIVDRKRCLLTHTTFPAIRDIMAAGDVVVLNDSKVVPARLHGRRATGGAVEVLVLAVDERPTPVMCRSSKRLKAGETIGFGPSSTAVVRAAPDSGRALLDFGDADVRALLETIGEVPLPPYIRRSGPPSADDRARYQTVYARHDGSVAAPTAGLHFSEALLDELRAGGIGVERLTLHVGPGTITPIRGDAAAHRMDSEHCVVSEALAERLAAARASGGRVTAIGTTTVRALETSAATGGEVRAFAGPTDLFIRPGHRFAAVDALITNFHLPGSTLLCLVIAFAGDALTRQAYEAAVAERYRFFSFGDAMLIV